VSAISLSSPSRRPASVGSATSRSIGDISGADPTKTHRVLGWEPRVNFPELVKMMVEHDIDLARRELIVSQAGFVDAARGAAMSGRD
jgi:hypothetical protein